MKTALEIYHYEEGVTHEVAIEVPTQWLSQKVEEHTGMELQDFLSDYTCDGIGWLYELAVSEKQIEAINNTVVLDGNEFRKLELIEVLDYFNISLNELIRLSENLDLKVYADYRKFYYEYYNNTYTKDELIEFMYGQDIEPPDGDYFILKNSGKVIYIPS